MQRVGFRIGVAVLSIVLARSVGAAEPRPFVVGDVLHRDFGTILESTGDHGSDFFSATGRIADPKDALATTFYRSSARRLTAKATVLTFGDPTWVAQELVGEFTAENGLTFKSGTVVAGDGATRRLELHRDTPELTARTIAWTSGPNRVITLDLTLRGGNRAAELPTEIVDAYLAAYPSSLPSDVVDTPAYHLAWMQAEMDRLLGYAKRNLALARSALDKPDATGSSSEEYRLEAVRLLKRAVALRASVYRVGDSDAFAAQLQQATIAAITPQMALDRAKVLTFTEERLREIATWWQEHREDW